MAIDDTNWGKKKKNLFVFVCSGYLISVCFGPLILSVGLIEAALVARHVVAGLAYLGAKVKRQIV